jgi:AraC family transcriptional regulator
MTSNAHGDIEYPDGESIGGATEWAAIRIEHRPVATDSRNPQTSKHKKVVLILSGQATVTGRSHGKKQGALALTEMTWLIPAAPHHTQQELDGPLELLHLNLPMVRLEHGRLPEDHIDSNSMRPSDAGGSADHVFTHLGKAVHSLIWRDAKPSDRELAERIEAAVTAHFPGTCTPPRRALSLDAKRLKRVLDFIEAKLASDISLDDLAAEACFSSFHFSRLFREATGLAPQRYVHNRRIHLAQEMLAADQSTLAQVALDTGFGSQANFTRAFRKTVGLTPGQYRKLCRR